jgi:hypothetical protein
VLDPVLDHQMGRLASGRDWHVSVLLRQALLAELHHQQRIDAGIRPVTRSNTGWRSLAAKYGDNHAHRLLRTSSKPQAGNVQPVACERGDVG